jgi:hypothetical protein
MTAAGWHEPLSRGDRHSVVVVPLSEADPRAIQIIGEVLDSMGIPVETAAETGLREPAMALRVPSERVLEVVLALESRGFLGVKAYAGDQPFGVAK